MTPELLPQLSSNLLSNMRCILHIFIFSLSDFHVFIVYWPNDDHLMTICWLSDKNDFLLRFLWSSNDCRWYVICYQLNNMESYDDYLRFSIDSLVLNLGNESPSRRAPKVPNISQVIQPWEKLSLSLFLSVGNRKNNQSPIKY